MQRRRSTFLRWTLMAAVVILPGAAFAQQIYKCTSASGKLSYADRPCHRETQVDVLNVSPSQNVLDSEADRRLIVQQRAQATEDERQRLMRIVNAPGDRNLAHSHDCQIARKNMWGSNIQEQFRRVLDACHTPRDAARLEAAMARAQLAQIEAQRSRAAVPNSSTSSGSHYVRGHFRKDGTYVPPHRATNRDSSKANNWSQEGNVNPNNGRPGVRR